MSIHERHTEQPFAIASTASAQLAQKLECLHRSTAMPVRVRGGKLHSRLQTA